MGSKPTPKRDTLRTTALIRRLVWNHHMGAVFAQEPVATGSRCHQAEVIDIHAIRALDDLQHVHPPVVFIER